RLDELAAWMDRAVSVGRDRMDEDRREQPARAFRRRVQEALFASLLVKVQQVLPIGHERNVDEGLRSKIAFGKRLQALSDVGVGSGDGLVQPLFLAGEAVERQG